MDHSVSFAWSSEYGIADLTARETWQDFESLLDCSPAEGLLDTTAADAIQGGTSPGPLLAAFQRSCRAHSQNVAVLETAAGNPTRSMTYGELAASVQILTRQFLERPGWRRDSRVALLLPNSIEYVAAFYATLLAGGVVVPLSPGGGMQRLMHIAQECPCDWLISTQPLCQDWPAAIVCPPGPTAPSSVVPGGSSSPRESSPTRVSAIFYTSGSTGLPKGVMLSQDNLDANSRSIAQVLPLQPGDTEVVVLPFCHAFGNSVLQTRLLTGGSLVLGGSLAFPETVVETIRNSRAVAVSLVPEAARTLFEHTTLLDQKPADLKYIAVAGGALSPEIAGTVAPRLAPAQLYIMYGQTEATARLSILAPELVQTKPGSIGRGIPDVMLEVVDDEGRPVPDGTIGTLRARGPNIMLGYWNDSTATEHVLRDGWLQTGDLARRDADGDLFPQGRQNELLKVAGHRLHPREVEAAVTQCFPQCRAAATGYDIKNLGTRVALFVVPPPHLPAFSIQDVRAACRAALPRHALPEHIELLAELPLTHSLKVDRPALRWRAEQSAHAPRQ